MRTFFRWLIGSWALAGLLVLPQAAVVAQVVRVEQETAEAQAREAVAASTAGERQYIAITFDDGPRRSTTGELLDALLERGVHATFFLIGEQLEGCEDLVKRMEAEGHQVGIHTLDHVRLTALSNADFSREVESVRGDIEALVGHGELLLRPPYGLVDPGVRRRSGSPIILWSIDPEDWGDKGVDRIVEHVCSRASDGDIILLHDIYPTSVEAAIRIVDELHRRGFLFLTVSELAREKQVELKNGEVYNSFPG